MPSIGVADRAIGKLSRFWPQVRPNNRQMLNISLDRHVDQRQQSHFLDKPEESKSFALMMFSTIFLL
jgi:hypothetical protein